ncbi:MAG: FtsX-like permease family protein [Blastocatellia bacterium]|nr:FtsX-like permease family protein [Blastocatellia bacterium]
MFFTFVLALLTGALFGLAPALQFSRPDLTQALKDGAAVSGAGFGFRKRRRTQNLLVIVEVGLSLVLLIGAGLLIRSIWQLHEEKLGFQPEKLLTRTVVGLVGDVKRFAREYQTKPEFYLPLLQTKGSDFGLLRFGTFIVLRVTGRPADLKNAVQQTVWSLDPDLPIQRIATMEDRVADVFAPRRFDMLLFGVFASVALLLAVIGIYGVIAYSVAQRTHEIGIRMALGATSGNVLWLVVRQGLLLTIIGVVLGTGAALALTRILKNLLFGVSATDPATFIGIALLLTFVALIASYLPARRATKVDPLVALQHE